MMRSPTGYQAGMTEGASTLYIVFDDGSTYGPVQGARLVRVTDAKATDDVLGDGAELRKVATVDVPLTDALSHPGLYADPRPDIARVQVRRYRRDANKWYVIGRDPWGGEHRILVDSRASAFRIRQRILKGEDVQREDYTLTDTD